MPDVLGDAGKVLRAERLNSHCVHCCKAWGKPRHHSPVGRRSCWAWAAPPFSLSGQFCPGLELTHPRPYTPPLPPSLGPSCLVGFTFKMEPPLPWYICACPHLGLGPFRSPPPLIWPLLLSCPKWNLGPSSWEDAAGSPPAWVGDCGGLRLCWAMCRGIQIIALGAEGVSPCHGCHCRVQGQPGCCSPGGRRGHWAGATPPAACSV